MTELKQQLESKPRGTWRRSRYTLAAILGLLIAGATNLAPVQAQALPFRTLDQAIAAEATPATVIIAGECLIAPIPPLSPVPVPQPRRNLNDFIKAGKEDIAIVTEKMPVSGNKLTMSINSARAPLATGANDSASASSTILGSTTPARPFCSAGGNLTATLTRISGEADQQEEAIGQAFAVAEGTLAATFSGNSVIGARYDVLHQGDNAQLDIDDLKFTIDGNTVSLADIQEWMGLETGGGAGDGPSIFSDRIGVFATGNFSFGDHDRTGRESGYDFNVLGTTVGTDYRLTDQLYLGMAFGYAATDTNFDRSGGGVDVDGYSLTLYSSYNQPGSFYLDGLLRYGWSDYESDRNFFLGGAQKAKADYEGIDYSASISSGYDFVFKGLSLQPFARFDYVAVDIDKYREKANSASAAGGLLTVNQQNLQSLRTALGGRASYAISTGYGVFVPTLRVEWQHEYKNNSRTIRSSLINNPGGPTVSRQSDKPDRNFLNLGAGVSAVFAHGFSGFLNYEALLGNQYLSQHTINVGMRMEF